MELANLRPAPWHAEYYESSECWDLTYGPADDASERFSVIEDSSEKKQAEALKFAALARNAFDVMMRRGWGLFRLLDGWYVDSRKAGVCAGEFEAWLRRMSWPDPFTALIEADRWYRENVEKP